MIRLAQCEDVRGLPEHDTFAIVELMWIESECPRPTHECAGVEEKNEDDDRTDEVQHQ
jgi:hypothetical protein